MIRIIAVILISVSSVASIHYAWSGVTKPETALIYNKAGMPRTGIRLLSLFLGVGGILLLLPQTFRMGGVMLIAHSLITIGCSVAVRDWKGGAFEFIFLQIPVFLVWAGYPLSHYSIH